jgi:hypothetical protein
LSVHGCHCCFVCHSLSVSYCYILVLL